MLIPIANSEDYSDSDDSNETMVMMQWSVLSLKLNISKKSFPVKKILSIKLKISGWGMAGLVFRRANALLASSSR